jgi:hypothetical protein
VLQLRRSGSDITAGWSTGQGKLRDLGTISMDLPDTIQAGVAVLNQAQSGAKPKTFQATFYRVWFLC